MNYKDYILPVYFIQQKDLTLMVMVSLLIIYL